MLESHEGVRRLVRRDGWENEGRVASVYDKAFRVLKPDGFPDKRSPPISPIELGKPEADGQWPLASPTKLAPTTGNPNLDPTPKSPVSEAGSYKLTPTIPQSPRVPPHNSEPERRTAPAIDPLPRNALRIPEPPLETEKDQAKEKKACCCIVM